MSLYEELKRRKVFKTLGVYSGVAFVVMQLAADLFPYLFLPDWTVTVIIIIAILGFPVTFFLSWTYDIRRDNTSDQKSKFNLTNYLNRKTFFTATGFFLMIIGVIFWFIYPFMSLGIADNRQYDASIAVLYMDNISNEDQSYFADGLTIELINKLSKIENLKVTPRIDIAVYKNRPSSITEIARQLKVDYLIDGSVKIFNKNLRVNISLFDASSGEAIWSDEYNDRLIDILKIQDQIASKVVSKLNDKLNITESDMLAIGKKSTDNLEAYNLIQKSYQYFKEPLTLNKIGKAIEPLAEQAIELDPAYSEAYALAALGKRLKWWLKTGLSDKKSIEEESSDKKTAKKYIDLAIDLNSKNRVAKVLRVLMPQWNVTEVSKANQIFAARSTMIDAKMLIQEFPDDLFCKSMYVYFSHEMGKTLGADVDDYRQQLEDVLTVYDKLKKIDFQYNEVTEIMASMIVFEFIPKLYAEIDEPENMVNFIKSNKNNFCQDGGYNCLNTFMLKMISEGYYTGHEYDEALSIINTIISKDEDELVALGFGLGDQRRSHYRYGMMNMKLGRYDLAIEGFETALSLAGKQAICEPCEFNFSEKEEGNRSDKWWRAQYNRRLGLVNSLKGDYTKASEYYEQAWKLNNENQESELSLFKSTCSYGYTIGVNDESNNLNENIEQCSIWVDDNYFLLEGSYDVYETIWQLYLYYNHKNEIEKAEKYLKLSYQNIDMEEIEEYKISNNNDQSYSKFFYSTEIIETFQNLIQ